MWSGAQGPARGVPIDAALDPYNLCSSRISTLHDSNCLYKLPLVHIRGGLKIFNRSRGVHLARKGELYSQFQYYYYYTMPMTFENNCRDNTISLKPT